ncbi:MAG: hypothetical protein QOI95_4348 [Acidimicrobiaceae bacterium]
MGEEPVVEATSNRSRGDRSAKVRGLRRGLVVLAVTFALLQLVPYGWRHSNPPVRADAPWPDAQSAAVARTACYSCHSNETHWPIYSYIAPASWLVRRDVDTGRAKLNFSEWGQNSDAHDAADAVANGSMPPIQYTLLHPSARLSDDERRALVAALRAMKNDSGHGGGDG